MSNLALGATMRWTDKRQKPVSSLCPGCLYDVQGSCVRFQPDLQERHSMQTSLALTAFVMGLAGGPHCVAMCGSVCAGLAGARKGGQVVGFARHGEPLPSHQAGRWRDLWLFQAGRLAGYATLGGIAAASLQALGWLSMHSALLRPAWTLLHVAAAMLGLVLLVQARQPVWLEEGARRVWARVTILLSGGKPTGSRAGRVAPLALGIAWALLPCGLLYSALLVAALSAHPVEGAAVMALFAIGSGISLVAGPWLWLRLNKPGSGEWAIRVAGLALLATSAWALWMGLVHDTAPWCTVP
jgi:uncharacterized protein